MTLKMTTAQVVETSVAVTNSSFQNYTHLDDHVHTTGIPGFKPFTMGLVSLAYAFETKILWPYFRNPAYTLRSNLGERLDHTIHERHLMSILRYALHRSLLSVLVSRS